jgi:hypothetical protein
MKAANFDVSHELDEFLMVEKPLTHTKRKANADLDKLKPELRELEEKSVYPSPDFCFLKPAPQVHRLRLCLYKANVLLSIKPTRRHDRHRIRH